MALAVVALTPIAVHEVIAPLVPAARQLPGLAAAAPAASSTCWTGPTRSRTRPAPAAVPAGPLGLRARGLRLRYPGAEPGRARGARPRRPGRRPRAGHRAERVGKSTFAAACLRFLDPAAGHARAGRAATGPRTSRTLAGDDVRRAVGLCEQDPHVFDATIADNLRLARPGAPDAELRGALADAQLLGWVDVAAARASPPPVGEHGARLSGGQRQRLALARALLADVRVLVLDEPTEHLDEPTARAFVADLEAATRGRTVIVLTHRPELFDPATWTRAADLAGGPSSAMPAGGPRRRPRRLTRR